MATKAPLAALYAQNEDEQKLVNEITGAYQSLRSALDNRQQLFDPTLLAMAQGFLAPTKSGGFGESLGNVAAAVGPAQEQERKRSMEEAKMRLELAQSELGMRQQASGMQAARNLLRRMGGPEGAPGAAPAAPGAPGAAPGAVSVGAAQPSGAQPSGLRNITTEEIAALGALPGQKDFAKYLLDVMKYDRDRYKVDNGLIVDTSGPEPRVVADLRKPGEQKPYEIIIGGERKIVPMSELEYEKYLKERDAGRGDEYAKKTFGVRIREPWEMVAAGGDLKEISLYLPHIGQRFTFRGTPRDASQAEMLLDRATKSGDYSQLDKFLISKGEMRPKPTPAAQGAPVAEPGQGKASQAAQPAPQTLSDIANLPLADQTKIMVDRVTAGDKPAQAEVERITQVGSPNVSIASTTRLNEIRKLASANPEVFGLIQQLKPGLVKALAQSAQEGVTVGPYRLSAPANEFLSGLKLDPKQDVIVRRMTQLLDEEFFARATAYKSVLGPQMSNADARLMQSPMARPTDQARLIEYWAMNGVLANKQAEALYKAYDEWTQRTAGRVSPRNFWTTDGRRIMNQYADYYAELQNRFDPR